MKKTSIFLFLTFIIFNLNAQDFKFGIKGGVNYSTPGDLLHLGRSSGGGSTVEPAENFMYEANYSLSYHFGAFANYRIKKFYIQPEVNYLTLNADYSLEYKPAEWTYKKFEFPILIGVNITDPLSFYAGPVFSLVSDLTLEGVEAPVVYEESTLGVAFGINYELNRVGINLRYEYDLKEFEEQRIDMVRADYGTNVAYLQPYNLGHIMISAYINILEMGPNSKRKKGKFPWNNIKCN